MVAIITGNNTGLERSSAFVLGSRGQSGSAALGRDGESVYVNAANGNLFITKQDEFLIGLGPDSGIGRAYNSQGTLHDGDIDNWQPTPVKRIWAAGGVNVSGATVTREDWDGSQTLFTYDTTLGKYVSKEGGGAYDTITYNGQWHWVDGNSRIDEYYSTANGYKISTRTDTDGNALTYAYNGTSGLLERVTTANGEHTDLSWSGSNLTQVVTTRADSSPLTRVRYTYDGSNRLSTVAVDLSPDDNVVTDLRTYVTTYTYDGSSKRIASIAQQDGSYIAFTHSLVNGDYRVTSYVQTVATGVTRRTDFDYSVASRTTVTDPAQRKTIFFYDGTGNLTQISYPADNTGTAPRIVQFAYNANGDVTSAALGPGNIITYEYDSWGNLTLERDSAGNTVKRTYGSKNELLTETRYLVPDPDGAGSSQPGTPVTARYAYDGENHLRYSVSAEGNVTQYNYDTPGQQTSAVEFAGNAYGIGSLNPTDTISEATLTTWAAGISDRSTTRRTETTYDPRGAVSIVKSYSKLQSDGTFDTGSTLSRTDYVYNQAGQLLSRVVSGSSASEVFVYDGLGRMTQATDFNGNVTRTAFLDASGQTVLTHANGLSEVSTYNRAGELVAQSSSSAGGNLIDLSGWPGDPANPPSGYATLSGWTNLSVLTDETRWANTMGPDGLPVVAIQAGQQDVSIEGGGNYTNEVKIDGSKAYEFTYYFKISNLDKHYIAFGLSPNSGGAAYVKNGVTGADTTDPYFYIANADGTQTATYTADRWYKLVAYVLPEGSANVAAGSLGGVYDTVSGAKVADVGIYRWNASRPNDNVLSRFFDIHGTGYQLYSTYFYQPEVRQVSTASVLGPDAATSLYRYDTLGRLRMTVDATGRRAYMMYDSVGRKVADIDADGSAIEYRYDSNDNLTSTTRYANKLSSGQIASLVDSNGNPTGATFASLRPSADSANDQWTFQVYDAAQRLVQTIDGTGATTVMTYDGASRITSTRSYANKLASGTLSALKAAAITPNYWDPTAGLTWAKTNLSVAADTAIDGASAYKFTVVTANSPESAGSGAVAAVAGDVVTLTLTFKAVSGSLTIDAFGLHGMVDDWGDTASSTATLVSGPGTVSRLTGGIFYIWGLSADVATRVTISRRFTQAEDVHGYFILGDVNFGAIAAGAATIVSAPVLTRQAGAAILPTADTTNDRTTRSFYDKDGRMIATLDARGGLTQYFYDKGGRKIRELGSYTAAASGHWATGTLDQLIADVGTNVSDRRADYVYDARGLLKYTIDAAARPIEYVHDGAGRAIRTVGYAGAIASTATYTMAYVASQLTSTGLATNAANRITRSVYDAAGQLAFSIDGAGAVSAFTYDNVGQVIKQVRYATLYTTAGDQTLSTMQTWASSHASDTGNRIDRSVYDVAGNLVYSVDAEGYVTEHRYDKAGRATKDIRYPAAYTVSDGVTPQSLAAQIGSLPSGSVVVTYAYDADGRLTDTTDGIGTVTHFTYDSFGQLIDTVAAYGTADASTTRRAYNPLGQVTGETAAYGTAAASTTTFTYDALGNLTSTVDVRGSTSFFYYDALGRQTLAIDAEGYATQNVYNVFDEAEMVVRRWLKPTGTISVTSWGTVLTDAKDAWTVFYRDTRGLLIVMYDAEGFSESYSNNAFGERATVTNKLGATTSYDYDAMGRLASEILPITVYGADGSTVATSITNRSYYDAWGGLASSVEADNISAQKRTTTYGHDKLGRVTSVSHDAVQVVADDLVTTSTVTPGETFAYDSRGNLVLSIDAAGRKVFSWYDLAGRKTDEVAATEKDAYGTLFGTLSHWTYDARGNVKTARVYGALVAVPTTAGASVPSGGSAWRETSFTYDASNRLLTSTVAGLLTGAFSGSAYATATDGVVVETVHYLDKGVVKEIDGNGNASWTWYDRLGRKIAQVDRENHLTTWAPDTNGNVGTETRYATKVAISFTQNNSVAELVTSAGTSAADRTTSFTYDRNGHRLTEKRLGVAIGTVSSGGVLTASTADATIAYHYNALGQVDIKTEANGEVVDYGYDTSGRLMWTKGAAFTDQAGATVRPMTETFYDALGNVVRTETNKEGGASADDRVTTATYSNGSAGRRLTAATDAMGFVHNFQYDAAGRVVKDSWSRYKSDGTTSVTEATHYRYDLAGRVILQANATLAGSTWTFGAATRIAYNTYGEVSGKGLTGAPGDAAVYQEMFEYDDGGRLWRTNSGDGTHKIMFYDKAGNATLVLSSTGADLSTYANAGAAATAAINLSTGGSSLSGAVTTIGMFDKRGQQVQSIEPERQLSWNGSSFVTATLKTVRAYNAFGEMTSETDPRGYLSGATAADFTTSYTYNAMGRMTKKESPVTAYTNESGTVVTTERPTELYYYDLSGRLDAVTDANGKTTRRLLLAGTGLGQTEALVTAEFHADNGVARTYYDVFGDAVRLRNELYTGSNATDTDELYTFDKNGQVTAVAHRGGLLTDAYVYDGLGRRTRHTNSLLGDSNVERTDYDADGRVVSQIAFGGDATGTGFTWSGTLQTSGLGTYGGWTKTTTYANGKTLIEVSDIFGRAVSKTDMSGNATSFAYDKGARMTSQSVTGETLTYGWFNTGLLGSVGNGAGDAAAYGYDAAGNQVKEWTQKSYVVVQNATASFDALDRMVSWTEAGGTVSPAASIAYQYDLNGNIRRSTSQYRLIDQFGAAYGAASTSDSWFRFDCMNRTVLEKGVLEGGQIKQGWTGIAYSYDAAGRRATSTRIDQVFYELNGSYTLIDLSDIEAYVYRGDGAISEVWSGQDTFVATAPDTGLGPGVIAAVLKRRASYAHDAMQRVVGQIDWLGNGVNAGFDRMVSYNAKGQIATETTATTRGTEFFTTATTNQYGSGGAYALGSVVSSETLNKKSIGFDYTLQSTVTTTNAYSWRDGAVQASTAIFTDVPGGSSGDTNYTTTYYYTASGKLASAHIQDGRARDVTFTTDMMGQVIRRDEADGNHDPYSGGDPHEIFYRYGGREVGQTGNNGTLDTDYESSIDNRVAAPSTGAFRYLPGSGYPSHAEFDPGLDPINSYGQGAAGGGYTAQAGDTLQGIALRLWGDASLWYKLAQANGLGAGAALSEGQLLTIPPGALSSSHNAATFKPYDAASAMGDLSPTNPKPGKKNCGMMGMILMVVIAVAVAVATSGAALAALAPASAGITSIGAGIGAIATGAVGGVGLGTAVGIGTVMAAGAIGGAVGSIASQAFGVAAGIQDKFNWKGVALSALSGGIGAGIGGSGIFNLGTSIGGKVAQGALSAAASSALTQGIGVATGLQKKFDWAGVAAAGVAGGVGASLGGGLEPLSGRGLTLSNALNHMTVSAASAMANAATRTLLNGSDFGDNIIAALPDVIGSTIGNMLAGAMQRLGSRGEDGDPLLIGGEVESQGINPEVINPRRTDIDFDTLVAMHRDEFAQLADGQPLASLRPMLEDAAANPETRRTLEDALDPGAPEGAAPIIVRDDGRSSASGIYLPGGGRPDVFLFFDLPGLANNLNNCYAFGVDELRLNREHIPQPGERVAERQGSLTRRNPQITDVHDRDGNVSALNVKAAMVGDGAVFLGTTRESTFNAPPGSMLIWVTVDDEGTSQDFHVARQGRYGNWSHKPGTNPVETVDASGARINDPSNANWNYGGDHNYNHPVGFFYVMPGARIGTSTRQNWGRR